MAASLTVRLVDGVAERRRFDELMDAHHWLGASLTGATMRYVAVSQGRWVALVGFGSAALKVTVRDQMLGWTAEQRYRRLRHIANNQRFCVLPEGRAPNVASATLGAVLRRVSADYLERRGYSIVAVETFTDPSRHRGTCYQATNFRQVGVTSGWSRNSRDVWTRNGKPKTYWFYPLAGDVPRLLTSDSDHPEFNRRVRRQMSDADLNEINLDGEDGLLSYLADVPDARRGQGKRHSMRSILSIAALATISGCRDEDAIVDFAKDLSQDVLARVDARCDKKTGELIPPSKTTFRRVIGAIGVEEFTAQVGQWLSIRAGGHARRVIAVDGKALRGSKQSDGSRTMLLGAMDHDSAIVLAQTEVQTHKTNEITRFKPLLDSVDDLSGVVVTADAMHCQRGHAEYLFDRGAHYIFGLKGNQRTLLVAAETIPDESYSVVHETVERGHGRIDRRYVRAAPVPDGFKFPHANQIVEVVRHRSDLADKPVSASTSYYVTCLTADEATTSDLAAMIRGHWKIENCNHWVRDVTFDEDRSQMRVGNGPMILSALRSLAIGAIRLAGHTNIKKATAWIGRDITRALAILAL